jgi:hypothetical protein
MPPVDGPVQEVAELRRHLWQLLSLIDDYEAREIDHDVTQITIWGAVLIGVPDACTMLDALKDAALSARGRHIPVFAYRELYDRIRAMDGA